MHKPYKKKTRAPMKEWPLAPVKDVQEGRVKLSDAGAVYYRFLEEWVLLGMLTPATLNLELIQPTVASIRKDPGSWRYLEDPVAIVEALAEAGIVIDLTTLMKASGVVSRLSERDKKVIASGGSGNTSEEEGDEEDDSEGALSAPA